MQRNNLRSYSLGTTAGVLRGLAAAQRLSNTAISRGPQKQADPGSWGNAMLGSRWVRMAHASLFKQQKIINPQVLWQLLGI